MFIGGRYYTHTCLSTMRWFFISQDLGPSRETTADISHHKQIPGVNYVTTERLSASLFKQNLWLSTDNFSILNQQTDVWIKSNTISEMLEGLYLHNNFLVFSKTALNSHSYQQPQPTIHIHTAWRTHRRATWCSVICSRTLWFVNCRGHGWNKGLWH